MSQLPALRGPLPWAPGSGHHRSPGRQLPCRTPAYLEAAQPWAWRGLGAAAVAATHVPCEELGLATRCHPRKGNGLAGREPEPSQAGSSCNAGCLPRAWPPHPQACFHAPSPGAKARVSAGACWAAWAIQGQWWPGTGQ